VSLPARFSLFARIAKVETCTGDFSTATDVTALESQVNDVRRSHAFTSLYSDSIRAGSATLPIVNLSDPLALTGEDIRPSAGGTTSLNANEQRILTFKLPVSNLSLDEAQVLLIVESDHFEPMVELLGPDGASLAFADNALRNRPNEKDKRAIIYTSVATRPPQSELFLVISSIDKFAQGAFTVEVNLNPRKRVGDESAVIAEGLGDVLGLAPTGRAVDRTDTLVHDFRFASSQNEFFFYVPMSAEMTISVRPALENLNTDIPPPIDSSNISFTPFRPDGTPNDTKMRVNVTFETDRGTGKRVAVANLTPVLEADTSFVMPRGEYILVLRTSQTPNPAERFRLQFGKGVSFSNALAGQ